MNYPIPKLSPREMQTHEAWLSLIGHPWSPTDDQYPAIFEAGVRMRKSYSPDEFEREFMIEGQGDA